MADEIVRTKAEISAARDRAQAAAFAAEDADREDDEAKGIYEFSQWLFGNSDIDPTAEMGEDL